VDVVLAGDFADHTHFGFLVVFEDLQCQFLLDDQFMDGKHAGAVITKKMTVSATAARKTSGTRMGELNQNCRLRRVTTAPVA